MLRRLNGPPSEVSLAFSEAAIPPICWQALALYSIQSVLPATLLTLNCLEALQARVVYTLLLRTARQAGPRGVSPSSAPLGLTLRPEPSAHTSMSSRRASSGPCCAAQATVFSQMCGSKAKRAILSPNGPAHPLTWRDGAKTPVAGRCSPGRATTLPSGWIAEQNQLTTASQPGARF